MAPLNQPDPAPAPRPDFLENPFISRQLDCFRNLTAIIDSLQQREKKVSASNSLLHQLLLPALSPDDRRLSEEKKLAAILRKKKESKQALIYIIVVLMFYAFSIVILMIKYIHRQRRQWEEEKMLKEILSRARQLTLIENKYLSARHFSRRLKMQEKRGSQSSETGNANAVLVEASLHDSSSSKVPETFV